MNPRDFKALTARVAGGTATRDQLKQLVQHACELRAEIIRFIDETDTWDQQHSLLGFCPWEDDQEAMIRDEVRNMTPFKTPVQLAACPLCKEPEGHPCRTTDGAPRVMPHVERRRLARRAARAAQAEVPR